MAKSKGEDEMKKCEYCGYTWEPRTDQPVACPRCKRRFDYPNKKENEKTEETRELK